MRLSYNTPSCKHNAEATATTAAVNINACTCYTQPAVRRSKDIKTWHAIRRMPGQILLQRNDVDVHALTFIQIEVLYRTRKMTIWNWICLMDDMIPFTIICTALSSRTQWMQVASVNYCPTSSLKIIIVYYCSRKTQNVPLVRWACAVHHLADHATRKLWEPLGRIFLLRANYA